MPLISYAPANLPGTTMILGDRTIGPTNTVNKTSPTSTTSGTYPSASSIPSVTTGTVPVVGVGAYPQYNIVGRNADVGEIADCLNQLVARIEALEAVLASNPSYGIVQI